MRWINRTKRISSAGMLPVKTTWAYNFDGVDDYVLLANKAINVDGDIDIEFYIPSIIDGNQRTIVSQQITSSQPNMEFMLYVSITGNLGVTIGGTTVAIGTVGQFETNQLLRWTLIGTDSRLYDVKTGALIRVLTITRGAVREPNAKTVIGARTNNALGTYSIFGSGVQRDIKINGVVWKLNDRGQIVQLPTPDGRGVEMFINPGCKGNGSSWAKDQITCIETNGVIRLTNVNSAYAGGIHQTLTTVVGTKYILRVKLLGASLTTPVTSLRVSVNSGTTAIYTGSLFAINYSTLGTHILVEFTATSTLTTIKFLCNTAEATGYVEISDLTCKPADACNYGIMGGTAIDRWVQVPARIPEYSSRFVYNFDGMDDVVVLANRAINPDGNIDIEFTAPVTPQDSAVISQCVSGTSTLREFQLSVVVSGGLGLQLRLGGSDINYTVASGFEWGKRYRVTLIGTVYQIFKNGVLVVNSTFTRGTSREPTATTVIGGRNSGLLGTYASFFIGALSDIKINGTLWPIADRNQIIQLPEPSGLGAELITQSVLENPAAKGSQWTYLGDGRWQFVGDGTLNGLQFFLSSDQPEAGYLEFEVESYSGTGQMTCTVSTASNGGAGVFTTVGVKRYFYKEKGTSSNNTIQFKRNTGVSSCIIKNISFKPLGTANPMTLQNTSNQNWQETLV